MKQTRAQTFATPLILLSCTIAGLIVGVIADGIWDWVTVAAMAVPLLVLGHMLRRRGG